jgi:hypothetical protein
MIKEFQLHRGVRLQREFIVCVFSSLWNNWNYVCLSNLIGTKMPPVVSDQQGDRSN